MIELIEKRKHLKLIEKLAEFSSLEEFVEFMNKEIELAYKAGYLQFNGFSHDMVIEGDKTNWTQENISLDIGDIHHLANLYLQSKGYKC